MSRRSIHLTAALGVHGWRRLDPLILASLQLEAPLLLIGRHGTAKTLLAERIADALGSRFRHYNASLINYDDLVGIPLPDENTGLRFVGTEGAVWGADFVFFDEVNRCRPDLQNKMFPIVHERRIAGVDLPDLRHRWAAMNPPSADGEDETYLGVEELDAALADRFWFVITVPDWKQLSRKDRERLITGETADEEAPDLAALTAACRTAAAEAEATAGSTVVGYLLQLVGLLGKKGIEISPRRAALLRRTILATWAAAGVLRQDLSLEDACELVLLNGLPQWAGRTRPEAADLLACHRQAWELARPDIDPNTAAILAEPDRTIRLSLALQLGADDGLTGSCVIGALADQPSDAHRVALAAVLAGSLRERDLTPAAWSAVAEWAQHALTPRTIEEQIPPGRRLEAWRRASARTRTRGPNANLEEAVIAGCGPELLVDVDIADLQARLAEYVELFGGGAGA